MDFTARTLTHAGGIANALEHSQNWACKRVCYEEGYRIVPGDPSFFPFFFFLGRVGESDEGGSLYYFFFIFFNGHGSALLPKEPTLPYLV